MINLTVKYRFFNKNIKKSDINIAELSEQNINVIKTFIEIQFKIFKNQIITYVVWYSNYENINL